MGKELTYLGSKITNDEAFISRINQGKRESNVKTNH